MLHFEKVLRKKGYFFCGDSAGPVNFQEFLSFFKEIKGFGLSASWDPLEFLQNPLKFLQNLLSEPAGTRPELLRAPVGLNRAPAEASWAQKYHFRPMADGLGHVGVGTPCFLHTFQRRSNRAPAIILEESTDRIENVVKGKSFMPPNSIASKDAANNSGPQSETSRFCKEKSKDLDSRPAGLKNLISDRWPTVSDMLVWGSHLFSLLSKDGRVELRRSF